MNENRYNEDSLAIICIENDINTGRFKMWWTEKQLDGRYQI